MRSDVGGLDRAHFKDGASPLPFLAACLARNAKCSPAWNYLESGLARGILDEASTRLALPLVAPLSLQQQHFSARFDQLEKQITAVLTAKEQSDATRAKFQELVQERQKVEAEFAQFAAEISAKEVYKLESIQPQIPADTALVAWVDIQGQPKAADPNGEHWACIVRRGGEPAWVKLPGSGPKNEWMKDDDELPGRFRKMLSGPPGESTEDRKELTRQMVRQRLTPLEPYLRDQGDLSAVKHLIVHSAWWMAGIPIEALTDQYTISYASSGTMFAKSQETRREIQAKGENRGEARLLALADPVFKNPQKPREAEPPDHGALITQVVPKSNADRSGIKPGDVVLSYAGTKLASSEDLSKALSKSGDPAALEKDEIPIEVWREGETLTLKVRPGPLGIQMSKRPAAEGIIARREGDQALRASRGDGTWEPLPGSRAEVEAIARLFPKSLKLIGSEASEQRFEQLAAKGELLQYRFLHLATHGELDDRVAMQSALILAQDQLPDPANLGDPEKPAPDGRLTAAEMLKDWKLDAELVTLSACQSGLGKRLGGEGYLGFAQALFLAGARSLALSLWKVDDMATALLMTRFYENLLGKRDGLKQPMPKAEALREAKHWLRNLTAEEVGQHLAKLPGGVRGEIVKLKPAQPASAVRPFEHPYYWSAFILLGDPY